MDELIKEISIKHNLSLEKDDPILIMHTLNEKLMSDNLKTQQLMLDQYKEEMEGIALRWANDAKDKSEKILSASLTTSKEVMASILKESAHLTAGTIKSEVGTFLSQIHTCLNKAQYIAYINIVAAGISFLTLLSYLTIKYLVLA